MQRSVILTRYLQFLNTHANQDALFRLVHNHKVISRTVQFHEEIDNLVRSFEFSDEDDTLNLWSQEATELRDAQLSALKSMIGTDEFEELLG